jgi:polysaccharide export outer membrane protein
MEAVKLCLLMTCLTVASLASIARGSDAADGYLLGEGDTLTIQVFDENELSGSFTVGEDGNIDYPLLGRVEVQGQTVATLDATLTASLGARFVRDPQIQVAVKVYGSQPVQVLGSVKQPGSVHLTGKMTVLDVIGEAGGVTGSGVAEVRVQFHDETKSSVTISVDEMMRDSSRNLRLSSGDVVQVSEGMVVYVSGEVNKPGAVPFTEGITITQALSRSGGTKRTARTREVYILRGEQRININLKKILKGKAADVALRPDDQIVLQEAVF